MTKKKSVPPGVVAAFDQIYQANSAVLDKMVETHGDCCTNEYERIASILAQIDAARMRPEDAHHILAVAVDRLAAMRNAADAMVGKRDE